MSGGGEAQCDLLAFLAPGIAHALASPLQVLQLQTALLGTSSDLVRTRESLQKAASQAERLLDLLRCFAREPRAHSVAGQTFPSPPPRAAGAAGAARPGVAAAQLLAEPAHAESGMLEPRGVAASGAACGALMPPRVLDRAWTKPIQIGLFLPRLVDVLRYALRQRAVRIDLQHGSTETPVNVAIGPTSVTVAGVLRALADAIPVGWRGTLVVDLHRQTPQTAEVLVLLQKAAGFLPFVVPVDGRLDSVIDTANQDGIAVEWQERDATVRIVVPAVATETPGG